MRDDGHTEFYRAVIFPCYSDLLQRKGLAEHMTVEEFVTFSKGMGTYAAMEEAEARTTRLVADMSPDQRDVVYAVALSKCLSAADQ